MQVKSVYSVIYLIALLTCIIGSGSALASDTTGQLSLIPSVSVFLNQDRNPLYLSGSYAEQSYSSLTGQALDVARTRTLDTNNYVSLSYEASSGLLGFSSGYIYAAENYSDFLGQKENQSDFSTNFSFEEESNVFMGVNFDHTFRLADDVALGLRAGVLYLTDIDDKEDKGTVSFLFVMPLAIKENVVITPSVHWSNSLEATPGNKNGFVSEKEGEATGSFYGALSITFAY